MKKILLETIILIFLVGCAETNQNLVWYPTKAGSDFNVDKYECVQQSRTFAGGGGTGSVGIAMILIASSNAQKEADNLFTMCMEARGYILKDKRIFSSAGEISKDKLNDEKDISSAGKINKEHSFIIKNDGTLLDEKTNLMWATKDNGEAINWKDAKTYCENYRGGGYSDWRMPTLNELAGLYDVSKEQKFGYHLTDLIKITHGIHWSSDTKGSEAVIFFFRDADTVWSSQTNKNPRVIPVRDAK